MVTPEEKVWHIRRRAEFVSAIRKTREYLASYFEEINREIKGLTCDCPCTDCMKVFEKSKDKFYNTLSQTDVSYLLLDWLQTGTHNVTVAKDHEDPHAISYRPNEDEKRRVITTFRKFVTRNFEYAEGCKDTLVPIEDYIFNALPGRSVKFREITGPDITKAYSKEIGGRSCMTRRTTNKQNRDNSQMIVLYGENPEVVSLLIGAYSGVDNLETLGKSNTIRCLVWKVGDKLVLDRLYTSGKFAEMKYKTIEDKIERFLKKKYKKDVVRRHVTGTIGKVRGAYHDAHLEVTVKAPSTGNWPFADSFRWGRKHPTLENHYIFSTTREDYDFVLESNDGIGPVFVTCDGCGKKVREHFEDSRCCLPCYRTINKICVLCNKKPADGRLNAAYNESGQNNICGRCRIEHTVACRNCTLCFIRNATNFDFANNICGECNGQL